MAACRDAVQPNFLRVVPVLFRVINNPTDRGLRILKRTVQATQHRRCLVGSNHEVAGLSHSAQESINDPYRHLVTVNPGATVEEDHHRRTTVIKGLQRFIDVKSMAPEN